MVVLLDMSKKDYIEFARIFDAHRLAFKTDYLFRSFVDEFCNLLERDNPNFDRDRFNKAVGYANDFDTQTEGVWS
jgi:hypothetical protein